MNYKKNFFYVENISTEKLSKKFKTPLYCYSYLKIKNNINNYKNNFKKINPLICFSVKSNSNIKILKEIKNLGLGADVVSKGEMMKSLKAGIKAKKIVFSGVGKTYSELEYAINKNILLINVESKNELLIIEKIAKLKKKKVDIGIRLNPNTSSKTLKQISTGKEGDKFGVNENEFINLVKYSKMSKFLELKCLSVHIGSQILSHKPYAKMLKVIDKVINKTGYRFKFIDLGGGIGISYEKNNKNFNFKVFNNLINIFLKKHNSKIIFEPGRSIIGNSGILISKIIYIKKNKNKNFIILDTAMNDFMRKALYGANHQIIPSIKNRRILHKKIEFVGPICESTDKFLTLNKFQLLKEQDLIIICDVGAYGMSLASNYNVRPFPAEILVKNSRVQIIRSRQKLSDLI
ncbi:MAG TPA: diaminopimelate decarboxylase [Candidatus Pelagibacter bacterium]|jgi:diaminopimelate decarboxylase|nr:diaminopimelate decarboxylase [Pelagibacteraceae bacterium]HJN84005.1 diaminopimelate decarboxylase [Candidatus Pelagibacter bacterium]|tara:strand:- start:321 stop:1535 length:1215 start_codon:yes stop_codon:yes gene_type:complete